MAIHQQKQNAPLAATFSVPIEFMDTTGKYVFRAYLGPEPDHDAIQGTIDRVLADVVAAWPDRTNDELYEEVHARLCGSEPMEREPLLLFMTSFVEALKRQLVQIATDRSPPHSREQPTPTPDVASAELPTNSVGDALAETLKFRDFRPGMPTTLSMAILFPEITLQRLDRLSTYRGNHAFNAQVYELYDFIECTDLEIAQLFHLTEQKIAGRLAAACVEIRADEPTTSRPV